MTNRRHLVIPDSSGLGFVALVCLALSCDAPEREPELSSHRSREHVPVIDGYATQLRAASAHLVKARQLAVARGATPAALQSLDARITQAQNALAGRPDIRSRHLQGGHEFVSNGPGFRLLVKLRPILEPNLEAGQPTLFGAPVKGPLRDTIERHGLTFSRAVRLDPDHEHRLASPVERHIPDAKGFNALDWAGLFEVHAGSDRSEDLVKVAVALEAAHEVEYATVDRAEPEPPPIDFAPETPSLVSHQSYWGPDPGIDIEYAWKLGLRGEGLTITDMEHSWGRLDHAGGNIHEDLHEQDIHYGLPWRTDDFEDHGVAVMGLLLAGENGYGINGAVPLARGLVYSVMHGDTQILAAAIDDLSPGDIMLMEMQRGDGGVPDIPKANWDLVKQAVDVGIVVVQTAGNGGQDMDSPGYDEYNARGDNGAIRVGAGSADTRHDALNFSTYGSSVHIQGWGQRVFTLGYGEHVVYGDDPNQEYTGGFNGTSSAGPVATAAVALVQSYAKDIRGEMLDSRTMRDLLVETGVPQGAGGHIGPLPDTRAAIERLAEDTPPDEVPPEAAVTFPAAGDRFDAGDSFEITAEATDDVGVDEVVLVVNGMSFPPDTSAPYSWAVANIPEGTYEAHVVATDLAGNQGTSATVQFTAGDAVDPDPDPSGTSGEPDPDTGGTGDGTGWSSGGPTEGPDDGSGSASGGTAGQDADDPETGCACRSTPGAPTQIWCILAVVAWARRTPYRRRRPVSFRSGMNVAGLDPRDQSAK